MELQIAHAFYETVIFIYSDHLCMIDVRVSVKCASGCVESDDENYCGVNDQAHIAGFRGFG